MYLVTLNIGKETKTYVYLFLFTSKLSQFKIKQFFSQTMSQLLHSVPMQVNSLILEDSLR